MPIKSRENLIGAYAFLISIILAVTVGIINIFYGRNADIMQTLTSILVILGLVSGYFVSDKEVKTFLFASASIVLVSFAGLQGGLVTAAALGVVNVSKLITNILGFLMFIFIPATIMVALKTVFAIAKG